jgi:hypothetical protein
MRQWAAVAVQMLQYRSWRGEGISWLTSHPFRSRGLFKLHDPARKYLWRQFLASQLDFVFVTNPLGQEGFMKAIPS